MCLDIEIVHFHDTYNTDYSSEGDGVSVPNPGPDADSSIDVVFHDIQWGEYQLIIGCGNDSVCSTLSQWIHFPKPVSVSAHPSYSQLSGIIVKLKNEVVGLKQELAAAVKNTIPSDVSEPPANYNITRYLEYAVGGLIAVLVCGLLIYYRATVSL